MKRWITISWLMAAMVLTLLFTNSCQHCNDPTDPDCGNYNPCYDVDGKADFECAPYLLENTDLLTKCDTLIAGSLLAWIGSRKEYDTYKWKIGSDTNYRKGKSFSIYFDKPYGTIAVTLIGTRKPKPYCLPGDDGVDTFTKSITIVDFKATVLDGSYRGSFIHNPSETFDIQIAHDDEMQSKTGSYWGLYGLFPSCNVVLGLSYGYKQFTSSTSHTVSGTCYYMAREVYGTLDASNQIITITAVTNADWALTGKKETVTFIGKRL
ncbi:MAG: hypothetical protein K1X81_12235 [Bacteroidia bacterium]|nr:hypothetical protein [Bacteroidia bacterium]